MGLGEKAPQTECKMVPYGLGFFWGVGETRMYLALRVGPVRPNHPPSKKRKGNTPKQHLNSGAALETGV